MKYKIEEVPNHDIQEFHVTEKVCSETLHSLRSSENIESHDIFKRLSKGEIEDIGYLTDALFAIDGIIEVGYHKYKLRITKADLFDWSEIEEQVLHVIKSIVAKGAEMVEIPRKACTEADRIRFRQEWERAERNYGGDFRFPNMDDFNDDDDKY